MSLDFIHGINYPWSTDGQTVFYGLDFGWNVWGSHLGVSTRREAIARDFDEIARLGFTVARWFVFCDGRSGIVYDDRGFPAGLDDRFFVDMDAALEIARHANVRLDVVLFDHHWLFKGVQHTLADPITGDLLEARLPEGRARILLSQDGQDALFERVLEPFIRRYAEGGTRTDLREWLFAFEFMNEPDFVIDEWERDRSHRVTLALPFAAAAAAVARLSDLVHTYSDAITTLGSARADNLWAWDSDALGLDALQLHAYPDSPQPGDIDPFITPAEELDLQRAVILGEFRSRAPLDESLEKAIAGGYAGAWPWSFSGTDEYGRLDVAALRRFGARHPELVNPRFADAKVDF
ncbi:MAG: hypothetical protein DMF88_25355 [Acidobacteria bacterium]|nr:MAG: hypothetical protein DMF88_25355 [Acidobacteriota bacterium]